MWIDLPNDPFIIFQGKITGTSSHNTRPFEMFEEPLDQKS